MQGLLNAISGGYSAKEVLNFLSRQFPELGPQIKNAISAGYTIDQVINFLEKGVGKKETEAYKKNSKGKKPEVPFEDDNPYNRAEKNLERSATEQGGSAQAKFLAKLPGVLGSAALGVAGGLGASALMKSAPLLGSLSTIGENLMKGSNPSPPSTPPIAGPLDQQEPQDTLPIEQSAPPVEVQPQEEYDLNRAKDLYEKWKKTNRALPLAKVMKTNLGVSDDTAIKIAQDLKASDKPESPFSVGSLQETLNREDEQPQPEEIGKEEKTPIKIEKGSQVPDLTGGVATVKGVDSKGALIETDGKVKRVPIEEIEEVSKQVESLDAHVEDIGDMTIKDIQSSVLSGFMYNKQLQFVGTRFHKSGLYGYFGVSPHDMKEFASANAICTTNGENEYGKWFKGKNPSFGAALNKYLKKKGYKYVKIDI